MNNAGVYPRGLLLDISVAEWDRVLDINLRGPFLVTREIEHGPGHEPEVDSEPEQAAA